MQGIVDTLRQYPELMRFAGVAGFAIYIAGFLLVQARVLCGNGNLFALSQIIAALCVLMSLTSEFNLASFLIQISYMAIGVMGVALRLWSNAQPAERAGNSPFSRAR